MTIPIVQNKKPDWFKIRPPSTENYSLLKEKIKNQKLNTVCQESHCPNMAECWSGGTATFMIMGDICTRGCRFCAIKTGVPNKLDEEEPNRLAQTIKGMNLNYIVLTSVDRDDLEDQGASHFAECITEVKRLNPNILVEVLTPDFQGNKELIKKVVDAKPDVFAHNVETTKELTKEVRDRRASFEQSLEVLQFAKSYSKEKKQRMLTKSSIMLGLGENEVEVIEAMRHLREKEVDVVTFGQYLKPKNRALPIKEYVKPEVFDSYKDKAEELGFLYCASGPFVRSSYKAGEYFIERYLNGKNNND